MAERLVAHYDPDAAFGFRFYQPSADMYLDLPGLMEGAAGIGAPHSGRGVITLCQYCIRPG